MKTEHHTPDMAKSPRHRSKPLAFLGSFLRSPSSIGSIAPSSRFLSRAMMDAVRELAPASDTCVYELGPGTGALTRDLSRLGRPLVLIEMQADFAKVLRERFPRASVREEDALSSPALQQAPRGSVMVSSLPILSLPNSVQFKELFFECLRSGRFNGIVQYSYGLMDPLRPLADDIISERRELVLRNLPPASVWVYRRK